ncbi:ABC transporter substrate-binding protein [Paenibacillus humicola]|uniref:ABC transporter substrate-binding protein n=1 Tax=Paenibacillus humicola TaxID=3110540 RepID=UPI00237B4FE2|nr:ABC transporter substrate-binding protein [Paenibacillus humicola]
MVSRKMSWTAMMVVMIALLISACGKGADSGQTPAAGNGDTQTNQPSGSDTTAKPVHIKVGLVCGGMTPLLEQIGVNDGSFAKAGLEIENVCFTAGADAVQALVGGSLDINLGSFEHVLKQQKNGLGVKAYGDIYNGVGYSLVVKSDATYKSVADLKGKTLAVTKVGSLSDTGLRLGLKDEGLDPNKDVTIIGAGSGASMLAAIQSGNVAGGMVSEPTTSQMLADGKFRILYDPAYEFAGITVMAKTDWVDKNKEAMQTFLKVLKEVNDRTQADPGSAVEPMKKDFPKISDDVLKTAITNQLKKVPQGLEISQASVDKVTQSQIEIKAIDKGLPFDQTVDLSLLTK